MYCTLPVQYPVRFEVCKPWDAPPPRLVLPGKTDDAVLPVGPLAPGTRDRCALSRDLQTDRLTSHNSCSLYLPRDSTRTDTPKWAIDPCIHSGELCTLGTVPTIARQGGVEIDLKYYFANLN